MSNEQSYTSDYNDSHRAFLNIFLSRKSLTFEQACNLLAKVLVIHDVEEPGEPEGISREALDAYIHAINDRISPFDFEIRSTRHQRTNVEIYALVNTTSDPLLQRATTHSADEIAFVRRVLDAMFETYNTLGAEVMAITSMQALKLAKPSAEEAERRDSGAVGGNGSAAAITGSDAETMMKDMVTEGWFEQSRGNGTAYYTLSPRALLELREWLIDTYNAELDDDADAEEVAQHTKIKKCSACKEIVTQGQRCSRQTCLGRLHEHCLERMFRAQGSRQVCPNCEISWDGNKPVGVKAVGTANRSNGVASNAGRSSRMDVDHEDE